jgi:predicted amidophosphoribosyltransferase
LSENEVKGRCVMLVDDVFTTGATLHSCALKLREGGAGDVHCLTVARAHLQPVQVEPRL